MHRRRKLIYFGGCDYFRLASHPEVLRALQEGLKEYGLNVAASRTTTGNHKLFGQLEVALAKFFRAEGAALVSSGYAANLAFTQSVAGKFTHALLDGRAHGSLRDASELLICPVIPFRHRDVADLRWHLRKLDRTARPLVMTDGMFAHDGSLAPLDNYLAAMPRRGILLVDDAHGAGTLGKAGRGTPEVFGLRDPRLVQTFSLSKAFGVYGGAVVGNARVVEAIQGTSRIFIGNTPPPLPLVSAVLKSMELLRTDNSFRQRLRANTTRIKTALRVGGIALAENDSPVVAIVPATAGMAALISRQLSRTGIFPPLIRYGGGTSHGFFRFAISSEHTPMQLETLAKALIAAETKR
jgi:7-keto-8-aminopelargonate synthetase-like enzyme